MPRPWYARSPWKDMLTHSVTIVVAIFCTLAIKQCTGVTVPVEAASTPRTPPTPEATVIAAAPAESGVFTVAPVIVSGAPDMPTAAQAAAPKTPPPPKAPAYAAPASAPAVAPAMAP